MRNNTNIKEMYTKILYLAYSRIKIKKKSIKFCFYNSQCPGNKIIYSILLKGNVN